MDEHLHVHPHTHDDDHHHVEQPLDDRELSRRRFLYLAGAGLLGPLAAADAAAAATRRTTTRKRTTTRQTTTTARKASTSTPAAHPTADTDPWSLFPRTVHASRTATEVIVESTGLPEHPMMIGIKSWQQQVPLPQPFSGTNAFRLPRKGTLASTPVSARTGLFRGAIALAVNGVPIFNALNNRGDDAFLFGELDQWGGHCGRADDYHYHVAPLHLQSITGPAVPIAFALDGFPLYGLTEPDGSPVRALDEWNGHSDPVDGYHYHATLQYPYINGGMRGVVNVRNDGVEPQPSTPPMRPPGEPLRGAEITAFTTDGATSHLEYRLAGATWKIDYVQSGPTVRFTTTAPDGTARTETFQRRSL